MRHTRRQEDEIGSGLCALVSAAWMNYVIMSTQQLMALNQLRHEHETNQTE